MLILGFNGGCNLVHEDVFDMDATAFHDAAAVLLDDGEVVAAVEQERLDRIKHSNKFPVEAIARCLALGGARVEDVDAFACASKRDLDMRLEQHALEQNIQEFPRHRPTSGEDFIGATFRAALGHAPSPDRLHFVRHHVAHAVSAFAHSGLERALVLTLDGMGEGESGRVAVAENRSIETLRVFDQSISLGHFYQNVIRFLGFGRHDEYKAMGLAPYGDPARFRGALKRVYDLLPEGAWVTRYPPVLALFEALTPRRRGEPFTQEHKDLAASLQEALEEIVLHVLRHHQAATGEANLCYAGGVAHNCTLNGKLAASGMFENVFVHPAADDAGCVLGAALALYYQHRDRGAPPPAAPALPRPGKLARLEHLSWGADVGSEAEIAAALERWSAFVSFERAAAVERRAAALIANGSVVGWIQGRSEFGPRALGNRSILADPRPAENKRIINAMVKKREGYRPFAPSVLEEDAAEYFVLPRMESAPFMIFVVDVREDKRRLLGAVTHVDGSARVQTVSRRQNARYHRLISEFKALTGVPVLLNTSFNNDAEPIVDSVEDGIVCFLTTGLDHLVAGDFVVSKRGVDRAAYRGLCPHVPRHVRIDSGTRFDGARRVTDRAVSTSANRKTRRPISADAFAILSVADGQARLGDLMAAAGVTGEARAEALLDELLALWALRLVVLSP